MNTEGLVLRSPGQNDVEWITLACQDPEIQRWTRIPVPYLRTHAEHFVSVGTGSLRSWVIVRADATTGTPGVGTVAIHHVDAEGAAEVGYWVAPWARRRGIAAWALNEVRHHVLSIPATSAITLTIAEENLASRRTAERVGFELSPGGAHRAVDHGCEVPAVRYRLSLARG